MVLLQVLERNKATGTAKWTEPMPLDVGFQEHWVLDKTTDSAKKIKVSIKGDRPKWDSMDWARILYFAHQPREDRRGFEVVPGQEATYTDDGLPLNHNQYVIGGYQCIRDKKNGKWIVSMELLEPIERFRGILGETLSYTNQTSKTVTNADGSTTTYTKDPYNHLTALERWLKVTPANCDNYDAGYDRTKNVSWYNRIRIIDSEWLKTLPFPDTTFNELTLYNVLLDNYDSSTGRTPVAYFNIYTGSGNAAYVGVGDLIREQVVDGQGLTDEFLLSLGQSASYTIDEVSGYRTGDARTSIPAGIFTSYNRADVHTLQVYEFAAREPSGFRGYVMKEYGIKSVPAAFDLPINPLRDEYKLKFIRQDGFDKPVLQLSDLEEKCTQFTLTKDLANYATGLVSNVSNLVSGVPISYPAQSLYAVPEVDADVRDTTGFNTNGDNWVIRFPHNIKRVTKVEQLQVMNFDTSGTPGRYFLTRTNSDKTPLTMERKQFLAENGENANNLFWYEEGDNRLHLRSYFYNEDSSTAMFYIEYEPLIDARIEIGDLDYVYQVNQSSSQVDGGLFSAFLNNYLKGMNKADLLIQKGYLDDDLWMHPDNFLKRFDQHIGCRVMDGDKEYIITNVSYQNRGFNFDVVYQLNENHVRKNHSYRASQAIRTNTAIGTDNLKDRKTTITQTVKIGRNPVTQTGNSFLVDKKILLSALIPDTIDSKYYPQIAGIKTFSKLKKSSGETVDYEKFLAANIAQFAFGDMAGINVRYIDNAEAGKSKDFFAGASGQTNIIMGDIKAQYFELFTDAFGETQSIALVFSSVNFSPLSNYDDSDFGKDSETAKQCFLTRDTYAAMANLPRPTDEQKEQILDNQCAYIEGLNELKDMLENFNITAQFKVVSDDMIICPALLQRCRLLQQSDAHSLRAMFFAENKAVNDDLSGAIGSAFVSNTVFHANSFQLTLSGFTGDCKSVIIMTDSNEKLLIINNYSHYGGITIHY